MATLPQQRRIFIQYYSLISGRVTKIGTETSEGHAEILTQIGTEPPQSTFCDRQGRFQQEYKQQWDCATSIKSNVPSSSYN